VKKFPTRRPSPALVVACLALFVALSGVGYAAATIGSAQIKNNSVKSADIKNGGIASKDLSSSTISALQGQKGEKGDTGAQGAPGAPGAPGADGADGTALAYAYVNADGTVDEARSEGVADANVVANGGIYGFRGLGFTPKNIVTTMAFSSSGVTGDNSSGGAAFVGDCSFVAGADQACVSTDADGDSAAEARPFFITFN
jgi:hypothetical protein